MTVGARAPRRAAAVLVALVAALGLPASAAAQAPRARFDTRVLAPIPSPGFPAHAYAHPDGRVYEGTYVNPAGDAVPSKVLEIGGTDGASGRTWEVPGQALAAEHGVQVATSDARGRLILLDRTPARALVLDRDSARVTTYARFPDLPTCAAAGRTPGTGVACSPAGEDRAPFANYAAWGPDGSLYVTDYAQAVVWRVPPRGGDPEVWLADPRLDGGPFGTAGIELAADGRTLVISQGSGLGVGGADAPSGHLYATEIGGDGRPGPLRMIWRSAPGDLPDGFAIARSGTFYVALVGLPAQLAVVGPDGVERERFPSTPLSGANGSPVPFDSPSNASFLGTRLMVANQSAIAGDASHWAVLDVETGEPGLPEAIPANAGPLDVAVRRRPIRIARVPRERRRTVTLRLSRGIATGRTKLSLTRRGRILATGVGGGRTVRLTLKRAGRLPTGRATIRARSARSSLYPTPVRLVRGRS